MKPGCLTEFTKLSKKKERFSYSTAAAGSALAGTLGTFVGAASGESVYTTKVFRALNRLKKGTANVPVYGAVRKVFPKMRPKEYIGKSLMILGLGPKSRKMHIGKGVVFGGLTGIALGALAGLPERKKTAGQEHSLFLGDMIADRSIFGLSAGGVKAGKKEQARYRQPARFGLKPKYKNPGEYTSASQEPGGPASRWSEISGIN